MSGWRRILLHPDGAYALPEEAGPDTVYFVEGTTGTETWGYGYPVQGADEAAARSWAATAQVAVQAVAESGAAVDVVGEGALAALVRLALPLGAGHRDALPGGVHPDAPPDVVVETTGTDTGLTRALRAVRTGGQVILAARPQGPTTAVDTYRDVHLRDVRLTAVPWAGAEPRPAPEHFVSWALAHLGSAQPGRPAPPGHWHRLPGGPLG
ncbi:hypothetical protein [Streptomyces sp. NPDC058718]|uniref:hypothetical protein n=1 Tax=Streptomyces sp. NPDC058718 TaxID=3346610 RepID=UPI0036C919C6